MAFAHVPNPLTRLAIFPAPPSRKRSSYRPSHAARRNAPVDIDFLDCFTARGIPGRTYVEMMEQQIQDMVVEVRAQYGSGRTWVSLPGPLDSGVSVPSAAMKSPNRVHSGSRGSGQPKHSPNRGRVVIHKHVRNAKHQARRIA